MSVADRNEGDRTLNVLPIALRNLLIDHLRAFVAAPLRYLATLGLALRTGEPGLGQRLRHVLYFGEAMVVLRHVRRHRIDHLHAQFADSATDCAMLVSHYLRGATTWSLAVHGSVEFYNVIRYGLEPKLASANFAVAISDFGRSQLMTVSAPERWPHIHVVRCGVDPDVYRPPAARSGTADRAEILCVGRLLRGKGLALLLQSVSALVGEGLDVTVALVGEGPARRELEHDARRLGLADRVRFCGAVGQDEIIGLYARADIFCLPSFAEGIPVVVMEAMAMELPVVTTRIMGIPELIEHPSQGRLVAPGRVDELTAALRELIGSPRLRRRIGAAGRAKVIDLYDVRSCGRELRAVLDSELGPSMT